MFNAYDNYELPVVDMGYSGLPCYLLVEHPSSPITFTFEGTIRPDLLELSLYDKGLRGIYNTAFMLHCRHITHGPTFSTDVQTKLLQAKLSNEYKELLETTKELKSVKEDVHFYKNQTEKLRSYIFTEASKCSKLSNELGNIADTICREIDVYENRKRHK